MIAIIPAGAAIAHDSATKHVSGAARYIDDLPEPPGLLHAFIHLSPHAHAKITRLDVSATAAMPGVAAVMTAVTGALPIRMDNAWVWPDATGRPAVVPSSSRSNAVDRCTSDISGPTTVSVPAVARCMLRQ